MTRFILGFLSIIMLTSFSPVAHAQEFSDAQRVEIKKMFEEYLLQNGEQVLESVNQYQATLEAKEREEASAKASNFLDTIKDSKDLPMAGNPKGDITVVEFFDYNCGYCRKALEEIQTVLKGDDQVKVIFMDMPILGPASLEAAKWSLAAHEQGKYFEYHQEIMDHNGEKSEAAMEKLAKDIGLDVEKLKKDKASEEIENALTEKVKTAQDLGIRGTPGFIVAGELFPGYIPADQIKKIIDEARTKAKED